MTFSDQADHKYVSLTTFRRNGEPVSTPVWAVHDGDAVGVSTPAGTGKLKRLRHDPRVQLRPCSRGGEVADGVQPAEGVAEILPAGPDADRVHRALRRRYHYEWVAAMLVERLVRRGRSPDRVVLRLTAD